MTRMQVKLKFYLKWYYCDKYYFLILSLAGNDWRLCGFFENLKGRKDVKSFFTAFTDLDTAKHVNA